MSRTDLNVPGSSPRAGVVVVALAVAGASPLQSLRAQELSPSLSDLQYTGNLDVTPTPLTPHVALGDSTKYPMTYWLEGALIAGIPLSLLGAALGGSLRGPGQPRWWYRALLG